MALVLILENAYDELILFVKTKTRYPEEVMTRDGKRFEKLKLYSQTLSVPE